MTEQEHISKIAQSLSDLEKQIIALQNELSEIQKTQQSEPVTQETVATEPIQQEIVATEPTPAETVATEPMTQETAAIVSASEDIAAVPVQKAAQNQPSQKKKTSSGFEENLGGKVMGIVAAILIFIGLFLFGSMLYERLGDAARVVILFVVSFLILGLGLFIERKRKSWFTTSLVGCGLGAVYITLFLTALYYEVFTIEILYLLLFFWLAGTGLYVFLRQSFTVAFLGQIGIAFSVIFGCLGVESKGQFTFLCFYFTVLSLLYLWVVLWRFLPKTTNKPYSWIHLTAFGLNLLQLLVLAANYGSLFGEWGAFGGKNPTAGILLCIYCLVLPLFFLLRRRVLANLSFLPQPNERRTIDKSTFPIYKSGLGSVFLFTIYQIIVWIIFTLITETLFESDVPQGLFLLAGLLISYVIAEFFGTTGTEARGITIVNATAVCFILIDADFPRLLTLLIPILFCIVTTLFGIFGNEYPLRSVLNPNTRRWEYICKQEDGRCFDKFTACSYLLPIVLSYQFDGDAFTLFLISVFGIAYFAGCFIFLFRDGRDQRFANGWRVVLYILGMFYIFMTSAYILETVIKDDMIHMIAVLTLLVLCNCLVFYTGFRKKFDGTEVPEPVLNTFVRTVYSVLWIWGIAMLHSSDIKEYPLLCVWMILLTLYLCGNGMYEQYKQYGKKTGLGIYFGLRVTFYTLLVMAAFEGIEGYVFSCVLLVLAVIAVLTGFPLRLAPLRIYGLCLAMFAVIKLLMIDVEHDNSMETVLCFLGAGILCFAINFIYNHVKKRFKNGAN